MSTHDSVVVLSRALDQVSEILAGIHEDQLDHPTPCGEWDVARLVAHVVATPANFIAMSKGEQPDWSAEPAPVRSGWTAAFRSGADDLIHIWHRAGAYADPNQVAWQTAEFAIHAWDLARATGQPTDLDPEVAAQGLGFMSRSLTSENRGPAFAAEVEVSEDASTYERLVAFAGRDPR